MAIEAPGARFLHQDSHFSRSGETAAYIHGFNHRPGWWWIGTNHYPGLERLARPPIRLVWPADAEVELRVWPMRSPMRVDTVLLSPTRDARPAPEWMAP